MFECPTTILKAFHSDAMPQFKFTKMTHEIICGVSISQTVSYCIVYNAMLLGERTVWRPEELMMHMRPAFQPSQHQLRNKQCDWRADASEALHLIIG